MSMSGRVSGLKELYVVESDGTVAIPGYDGDSKHETPAYPEVSDWMDVKSICCGHTCAVGICTDGTILFTGTLEEEEEEGTSKRECIK